MAKNSVKISVVLPTFNREGYICHAIQSIMDQTYDDWELIVIDDGSTDDTKMIVDGYRKKDKRVRYYKNKENKGISYSRNRGNKLAKGEIIVVQDSDDMSMPDRLEHIAEVFKIYPKVDIVYHHFYIRAIDIYYGLRAVHREIHKCGEYNKKRAISEPYIPGQLAYRKNIGIKYRESLKSWDDWGFIIDATCQNKSFVELKKPLYEYVISEDSVTTQSDNDGSRDIEKESIRKILKEYGINAI